jgi:hypothetical protein
LSRTGLLLAAALLADGASAANVVPWLNAAAAAPQVQTAQVIAQHACADSDLQIAAGSQGARKGFATQEITLTNRSASACFLNGAPEVQLLPATGGAQTLGIHPNASSNVQERVDLAPGDSAVVLIGTPGSCDAATGPQRNVQRRVKIVSPGGGARALDGVYVDTLCGNAAVLHLHVLRNEPAPSNPLAQLIGTIAVSAPAAPGSILHYTVTLTNPTASAISLAACPSYTESLAAEGTASDSTFLLNCGATGNQIAAGASVTYDMQIAVPASIDAASAKLSWKLQDGPGVGAIVSLK